MSGSFEVQSASPPPPTPGGARRGPYRPGVPVVSTISLGLLCVFLLPFLPDLLKHIILPREEWHPSLTVVGYPMNLTVFLATPPVISFLVSLARCMRSGGIRNGKGWLTVRLVLAGLTIFLLLGSYATAQAGRALLDARLEKGIARLQAGMSRIRVETVILEANASVLPAPRNGFLRGIWESDDGAYAKMQDAVRRIMKGENIDLRHMPAGLLALQGSSPMQQLFRRRYYFSFGTDRDEFYELLIEYDDRQGLQQARYFKRVKDYDTNFSSCKMIMAILSSVPRETVCPDAHQS